MKRTVVPWRGGPLVQVARFRRLFTRIPIALPESPAIPGPVPAYLRWSAGV